MPLPRKSFKIVIRLTADLAEVVDNLEDHLLSSVFPIPQDLYQTTTALIGYCRERIRDANNFRRRYRDNAVVRFFDWIWLGMGTDRIAQYESKLEDCEKAVELATATINALSIAHERRRTFDVTERDCHAQVAGERRWRQEIIQQEVQCQKTLRIAHQRTGSRSYLRKTQKMRREGLDLAPLRGFARKIFDPDNPGSISTSSSGSSPEPPQNGGYPRHPRQTYHPIRPLSSEPVPHVYVVPQKHEHGPLPYFPHSRNPPNKAQRSSKSPRIVSVSPPKNSRGRSLCEPRQSPRARSPRRSPQMVELRERESGVFPTDPEHGPLPGRLDDHLACRHTKSQDRNSEARKNTRQASSSITENEPAEGYVPRGRGSTSANRARDFPAVSDQGMAMNERLSDTPQGTRHNTAPTYIIIEPRQFSSSGSRRRSPSCRSDNKQAEYQNPARESSSTSRRKSSRCSTTYVNEPSTHRRPQANDNIRTQSSSSYNLRQTERRKSISRSRPVSPEDEQNTRRRRTLRRRSSSFNLVDYRQTEKEGRSSRSGRSSSISQGDEQQTGRSKRTSTSSSRPLSMSYGHLQQTERGKRTSSRFSHDSGIYVTSYSSRYTASDRPLPREPNINRKNHPPISMSQRMSKRTPSASSYDSGVFMSSTASYMSRNGSDKLSTTR